MPDTATAIGPVVRMCDDPDCGRACPSSARDRARITDRTLGISHVIPPELADRFMGDMDKAVCRILTQDLALNYAPDSHGVKRMIPDGCEFTIHKDVAIIPGGQDYYAAIYSGAATSIDGILDGAPLYDPDVAAERLTRMFPAGTADG